MCGIFCTIQDIASSFYDLRPPCLCHHTHYIWQRVHCICVITSTLLMISHQLYFWDHICYNSWHHIHYIWHDSHWIFVITPTRSMISQPIYVWHHTHYMYNIMYPIWGITPLFYEITPHYISHHMHCILDITPSISDTTSTLSVSSRPVYQLYHTNSLYDITHYVWHHSQYAWHHMNTLCVTPIQVWHHKEYIYDIITIYMISTLLVAWKHNDYT